jgi:hypothetical protein
MYNFGALSAGETLVIERLALFKQKKSGTFRVPDLK